MLHLVISRRKTQEGWVYTMCHFNENAFDRLYCDYIPEDNLKNFLWRGNVVENVCLSPKGELKGTPAALSRLDTQPWLVLSRMCYDTDNTTIGYRIITAEGKMRRCKNSDIIAYCEKCTKAGKIPFQNAIFHAATEDTEAHIKSYPDKPFIVEQIKKIVNKYAVPEKEEPTPEPKEVKITIKQADISELEPLIEAQKDLFTPEQKKQLKLGIQNNVNITLYANPEISWQKMKIIRQAMQFGYDVRPLVQPDYIIPCQTEALMYMTVILAEGIDVRQFLNPNYTMAQLSELHAGYVSFVDINKFADPNLMPKQMFEIRTKLEEEQWGVFI